MEEYVPYRAYVVRLWRTRRVGRAGCRATAEDVSTGKRSNFADLEGLFAFLRAQEREAHESLEAASCSPQSR
jgi:hypothetical protein